MNEADKIIELAHWLFFQYGMRSVTMDQIARELGISKKTLYQHFNSKADLVHKTVERFIEEEECMCEQIMGTDKNAIEQLIEIGKMVSNKLKTINPTSALDLKRYYKKSWQLIQGEHRQFIYKVVRQNMEKGMTEGWYRDDLNVEVICRIYLASMDLLIDPEVFPPNQFQISDTYTEFLKHHIYGIASLKGAAYFDKYLHQPTKIKAA